MTLIALVLPPTTKPFNIPKITQVEILQNQLFHRLLNAIKITEKFPKAEYFISSQAKQ